MLLSLFIPGACTASQKKQYLSHMFLAMFELRKYLCGKIVKENDHVQFYIKFNSESFQICYMVSLYHRHQYVGVYNLIYVVIFYIFCVLSLFLLRKVWPGKMLRFLIKSYFLSSSHLNFFKFATLILYHSYQYVCDNKFIYILLFFAFLCVFFQCFYLEKYGLGKC